MTKLLASLARNTADPIKSTGVPQRAAGVFDTKEKVFKGHTWEGDLEIVSIGGNINTMNGETYTHFHISVADESGNVYGGHLTEAVISGTGELVLTEIEGTVDRKFDEEIGLNLFEF